MWWGQGARNLGFGGKGWRWDRKSTNRRGDRAFTKLRSSWDRIRARELRNWRVILIRRATSYKRPQIWTSLTQPFPHLCYPSRPRIWIFTHFTPDHFRRFLFGRSFDPILPFQKIVWTIIKPFIGTTPRPRPRIQNPNDPRTNTSQRITRNWCNKKSIGWKWAGILRGIIGCWN